MICTEYELRIRTLYRDFNDVDDDDDADDDEY